MATITLRLSAKTDKQTTGYEKVARMAGSICGLFLLTITKGCDYCVRDPPCRSVRRLTITNRISETAIAIKFEGIVPISPSALP